VFKSRAPDQNLIAVTPTSRTIETDPTPDIAVGSVVKRIRGTGFELGGCHDLAEPVRGSVLALEVEVGTANGSGQLRLLPRELELRGELRGEFHPFGELEPDRVQPALVGGGSFISAAQAGAIPIGGLKPLCK